MIPRDLRSEWLGTGVGVKLRWRIELLETVMLTWTHVQVYSRASESVAWAALGSPVPLVAATYEYSYTAAAGTETVLYTVALWAAGPVEGDKAQQVVGSGGGRYATVADVRDEGITETEATNARVRRAILKAEAWFERTTKRWFYPRQFTNFRTGGTGNRILPLHMPIIQIDSVETLSSDWPETDPANEVDLESIKVYNRHLTMGNVDDDDREDPKIVLDPDSYWPKGRQNIQVGGWFGYTELGREDVPGETEEGSQVPLTMGQTPVDVQDVIIRLALRDLPLKSDPDEEDFWTQRHRVSNWKTRDQQIQLLSPQSAGGIVGRFTGDPLIDSVVAQFMAPSSGKMV